MISTAYGINLQSTAYYWGGIEAQLNYPVFEAQFDVLTAVADRRGERFTPTGEPILDYMRNNSVDVVSYISPFFAEHESTVGSFPNSNPDNDPSWFRLALARAADKYDWWLRCKDGSISREFFGGLSPLDIFNADYIDWLVNILHDNARGRNILRFDNAFWTYETYIKCPLVPSEDEIRDAQFVMYDRLRESGWRVVANGAWAPLNPEDLYDDWVYPAMDHLDGIMVEDNGSVLTSEGWLDANEALRRSMAKKWQDAGKVFISVCLWNGDGVYEKYVKYNHAEAQEYGFRLAVSDIRGQTPWNDIFNGEPFEPLFSRPLTLEQALVNAATNAHCVRLNYQAALHKAIIADEYQETGNEAYITHDGVEYACQFANAIYGPGARVYYVAWGDWNNVKYIQLY